ncbi:TerC family protein [Mycolicibacillus trivialis]|uniref:Tellurium resistance protein TerC n=1 Tax=Mycolicibacillus trivialis TaxID=1798 RepID=A0A1X2EI55_9MYCO|nr:TerC family protein [Mycolicibacillus trivialis]ORX02804.1 tellurium resistance protein TerC [Mycolicibacillus trivialis]
MQVSTLEWIVTLTVAATILLFDVAIIARRPHEPSTRECAIALTGYLLLAVAFGLWVWFGHDRTYGMQFFAGWITEYSLSVDNLFVFVLIIASFKVPKRYEQEALFVGIVLALLLRGVFIALGAVAIQQFSWIFYIFGAFLLYTGITMARRPPSDEDAENKVVRFARTHFKATDDWSGLKLYVKQGGKRVITPMFLVVLALGTTDVIFALDSIPAVYGLTREPYLVFTANALALMGLRQLYFLLGKLLQRLVYLRQGLTFILCFIAVKMLLQALHSNDVPFLNGGRPIALAIPEIRTWVSLAVIAATIIITTVASLYKSRVVDGESARSPAVR